MAKLLATRHIAFASAAVYVLCLAAALFTELLSTLPGTGISIWLSSGLLLAAALVFPPRQWPWLGLASAASELTGNLLWYGHDIGPALLFATGNVAAALFGAYWIGRIARSSGYLQTVNDTAIFLFVAAVVMPLISASVGSVALSWSYDTPRFAAWLRIFVGDATGATIAAPIGLLMLGAAGTRVQLHAARQIEFGLLIGAFLGMAAISLGGLVPFAYLMIAPTIWAALRFRMVGAIVASAVLMLLTALSTLAQLSPFAGASIYGGLNHFGMQLFLLISSVSALLVGAISEENRLGWRQLRQSNDSLEQRVADRSAMLAESEAQARETAALLTAIGEASPDLIYAKNLDHKIIYANRATLATFGVTDDPELQLAEASEAIQRHDDQVLSSRQALVVEEDVTLPDGRKRIFRTTKAPMYADDGDLAGLAAVSIDISDLKEAQAREQMLVREIDHRSRNLLAVVQGIIMMAKADSVADYKSALSARIQALARTNRSIAASEWHGADLLSILTDELAPFDDKASARVTISGDNILLQPDMAQSLTLVIHELATNAVKYGALSVNTGRLIIAWKFVDRQNGHAVELLWQERDGPPLTKPSHSGFGSKVIEAVSQDWAGGSVDFDWSGDGLVVTLVLPIPAPLTVAIRD